MIFKISHLLVLISLLWVTHAFDSDTTHVRPKNELKTSYCENICYSMLGSILALVGNCASDPLLMLECGCTQEIFIQSLALCTHDYCTNEKIAASSFEEDLFYYCSAYVPTLPSYEEALNFDLSDVVIMENITAGENITKPVSIDANSVYQTWLSVVSVTSVEHDSHIYAGISLAYWAGVITIATIWNWAHILFPSFGARFLPSRLSNLLNHYIFLPASFGKTNAAPFYFLKLIPMHMPLRIENIVLGGYWIILFVTSFVNYYFYYDTVYTYVGSKHMQIAYYLGIKTGYFATYSLPLLYTFAMKNNIITILTGWSYETFNVYHRWIARAMVIAGFIHAVTYSYALKDYFFEYTPELWMRGGIAAESCGFALLISSVYYFRHKCYEIFLLLHIALAAGFTATIFYHLKAMEVEQWMWATIAIWAFDRFCRLVRMFYFGLLTTADVYILDDVIFAMDVKPSRKVNVMPGQYVYINILRYNFWESHPFSVVAYDKENGIMNLKIKKETGMTRKVYDFVAKKTGGARGEKVTMRVWLDGPYGFTNRKEIASYDNVVLFAGGIGITPVLFYSNFFHKHLSSIVSSRSSKNSTKNSDTNSSDNTIESEKKETPLRVTVVWVAKNDDLLQWVSLENYLKKGIFDAKVYITDKWTGSGNIKNEIKDETPIERKISQSASPDTFVEILSGRPDLENLVQGFVSDVPSNSNIMFYVCGPSSMVDTVRSSVADVAKTAKPKIGYIQDSFSW